VKIYNDKSVGCTKVECLKVEYHLCLYDNWRTVEHITSKPS